MLIRLLSIADPESVAGVSEVVGVAEIARIAKTSKQNVTNMRARRKDFPAPMARLECGPVYRRSDVEGWLERSYFLS
jgi:hypothetical protein